MKKLFLSLQLLLVGFLLTPVASTKSYAMSCFIPHGKGLIQQYDLIFKGTSLPTKHNMGRFDSKTSFKIHEIIKGSYSEKIDIYHTRKTMIAGGSRKFEENTEYIIFARHLKDDNLYTSGGCSPKWKVSQIKEYNHSSRVKSLATMQKYQSLKSGLDKLIKEYDLAEHYLEKAKLFEEYKDYEQAQDLYKSIASKAYEKARKNKKQSFHTGVKLCPPPVDQAPAFIKNLKAEVSHDGFKNVRTHILAYGRILFNLGDYKSALRPLCLAGRNKEAIKLKIQTLVKLGLTEDLEEQQIDLSEVKLKNIDLSNLDLQRADFSGSIINNLKLNSTNLTAANLEKVKWNFIEANKVNLSGANLVDSEIRGNLNNSDLSYVNAKNSLIRSDLNKAILKNANFEGASISGDMVGANLEGANLKGANIRKLTGAILKDTNLNGIQSSSGMLQGKADYSNVDLSGFNLSGSKFFSTDFTESKFHNTNLSEAGLIASNFRDADFTNANLENADLSSSSREETNLRGANLGTANLKGAKLTTARYDCKTTFPEGFNPRDHLMVSEENCSANDNQIKENFDFSRNSLLSPPDNHYRLVDLVAPINFKRMSLEGTNFEGVKVGRFQEVNLSNSNFRHVSGVMEAYSSNLDNVDFSYSGLNRLSLKGKNSLNGAKFYCANLNNLLDRDNIIEGADLTAAIFRKRNFEQWSKKFNPIDNKILYRDMPEIIKKYGPADYSGMDFSKCNLEQINFGETNLSQAKFKGSALYKTDFRFANLKEANFDGAIVSISTKFPPSFKPAEHKLVPRSAINQGDSPWQASYQAVGNTHYSRMYKAPDYAVPDFTNEDLDYINYAATWLPKSNMKGASLRFTNFKASNLIEADLSNTDSTGAVFYNALLDKANFTNANLYGADLRWARMDHTILDGVTLTYALYDSNTKWPEGFDPQKAGAFLVNETMAKKKVQIPVLQSNNFNETNKIPESDKFTALPRNTKVIALGLYSGLDKNDKRCGHGSNKQCVIDVSVQKTNVPIFLVLSAYEPSTWRLEIQDNVELAGILVSGNYEQSIKGVPGNIKVINYSSRDLDYSLRFFAYNEEEKAQVIKMNNTTKILLNKEVDYLMKPDEDKNFTIK